MMKRALIGIAITSVIICGLNALASHEFKIEKEITINHSRNFVFAYLKFFRNGTTWNPFLEKDPKAIIRINGTDGMAGSSIYWSGNMDIGTGSAEIKTMSEGSKIEYEIKFLIPFKGTETAYVTTEALSAKETRIKWGASGFLPFPINIIAMLKGLNATTPNDFERGLSKLKNQLETLIEIPEMKL